MLKLITLSYKTLFKNFHFILIYSLPLLALSGLNIYLITTVKADALISRYAYISTLLLPFVAVATEICIYRKLFQFNLINPLSCINSYIRYLLAQFGIGIISSAPMFLINFIFLKLNFSPLASICLAALGNIFIGFAFMARFNIVLPLIIQNKLPSLKDFLIYTKHSYTYWLLIAALIYMPYVIIHYITIAHPYLNTFLTTIATFLFISFNVCYVNSHRLNKVTSKTTNEIPPTTSTIITEKETKTEKKTIKEPKKTTKTQTKKTTKPQAATPKKASKRPPQKLKPVTA